MEKLRNPNLFESAGDPKYTITQADGQPVRLEGYAIVWNVLSSDRGGYVVKLLKGSATFSIPTFALYNHDYANPLARNDDGSLIISQDGYGVKVSIALPDTNVGRDLQANVGKQLIRGMSFAMLPEGAEFEDSDEGDMKVRSFSSFLCDEVTITAIPAFDQTSIKLADTQPTPVVPSYQKELDEQLVKLEKYRLDSYSFSLAELQR